MNLGKRDVRRQVENLKLALKAERIKIFRDINILFCVISIKIDLQIYLNFSCLFLRALCTSFAVRLRCVHFRSTYLRNSDLMKNSRSIAGNVFYFWKYLLLDTTDYHTVHLPWNISAPSGQNFFYIRTWCRSRSTPSTERQKGVRDRHENDPRGVHPLADLCYHMVLHYHQLAREIDAENISPFNTSLLPINVPSFSLSLSLFFIP